MMPIVTATNGFGIGVEDEDNALISKSPLLRTNEDGLINMADIG